MTYKQRITKYYSTQVKSKSFQKGDLILRRAKVSKPTEQGKLALNWKGSYRVTDVIRLETYKIENLDGSIILCTWNSKNLKKYYQ